MTNFSSNNKDTIDLNNLTNIQKKKLNKIYNQNKNGFIDLLEKIYNTSNKDEYSAVNTIFSRIIGTFFFRGLINSFKWILCK